MINRVSPLIVQSYWTKPLFNSMDTACHRIDGGWDNSFIALCAYAYSGLSISKYYPNIVLYTDDFGAKLFGDVLSIPYNKIYCIFNNLDFHPNLWALSKVYTYSLQTSPFIHIDNDIFLWSKLPNNIEEASLCCQNKEIITSDYIKALKIMNEDFKTIPSIFNINKDQNSINAGILGGNNINFIHEYSNFILSLYKQNKRFFEYREKESGFYNIILEQLAFAKLASENNEKITYLIEGSDFNEMVNQVMDIFTVPVTTKYIHLLGNLKKYTSLSQFICNCLRYEYPDQYEKIKKYCNKMGLEVIEPIGKENYESFCFRYEKLSKIKDIEKFMSSIYFKLPKDAKIERHNNITSIYYYSINKNFTLTGWSLILTLLSCPKTGNDLVKIMYELIGDKISKQDIFINVFFFLIRSLYGDGLIVLDTIIE